MLKDSKNKIYIKEYRYFLAGKRNKIFFISSLSRETIKNFQWLFLSPMEVCSICICILNQHSIIYTKLSYCKYTHIHGSPLQAMWQHNASICE